MFSFKNPQGTIKHYQRFILILKIFGSYMGRNKTLDKEVEQQKKELEALLDDLPHKPEDLTDEILSEGAEMKKEKPKNIWITAK